MHGSRHEPADRDRPGEWAEYGRLQKETFGVAVLVTGLERPWAVAFLPDGRLLITGRPARRAAGGGAALIAAQGQGGLLDVAFHPQYETNGWLYLSYVAVDDGRM